MPTAFNSGGEKLHHKGITLLVICYVVMFCSVFWVWGREAPFSFLHFHKVGLLVGYAVCIALFLLVRPRNCPPQWLGLAVAFFAVAVTLIVPLEGFFTYMWWVALPPVFIMCSGIMFGGALSVVFLLAGGWLLLAAGVASAKELLPLGTVYVSITAIYLVMQEFYARQCHNYACLAKSLETNALTDALTGLGNRRDFLTYFTVSVARAQRAKQPLSIALVDIDDFKKVNDTYGHLLGDAVLCHVATILAQTLRASDRVFRWGGEEFVVLMADTCPLNARHAAEKVRKAVQESPFVTEDKSIIVTISIGLHTSNVQVGLEAVLEEADRNLYLAKQGGKNQVVM